METKEQCKNCEIINADCEGCKEFNKNIRNLDLEIKEQKIKRFKHQIRINNQGRKAMKHSIYAMNLRDYNKEIRQQIKELEDEHR